MKPAADCKFFKGDIPCEFHKKEGALCTCDHYIKKGKRFLIIKLGAVGDVIRTTPLLRKLVELYPDCEITWITHTPEILPKVVDVPLKFTHENILTLLADEFDVVFSLDKDRQACALANLVKAKTKKGFKLENGHCAPFDKDAEHKFLVGLDDNLSSDNKRTHIDELFEIAGFPYSKEEYLLDKPAAKLDIPELKPPVVGLNTGHGVRWKTRQWPEEYWFELARLLKKEGLTVVLLGGEPEHKLNERIAKETGVHYFGVFPLLEFFALLDRCDVVVALVTMATNAAIGLKKKVILLIGGTPKWEFEFYGKGTALYPTKECECYMQNDCLCPKDFCMKTLTPERVFNEVKKWVAYD